MRRGLLMTLLLATPATAQQMPMEQVTSYGHSLVGVWRVDQPDHITAAGFLAAPKFGPPRPTYCRIAPRHDDLAVFCIDAGPVAAMTVEEKHVHVAWGTMMLRFVMDGEVENTQRFHGRFQIKAAGLTFENPAVSQAVRIEPDADAPDDGGAKDALRRVLEQGLAGIPHAGWIGANTFPEASKMGAVSAIAYVGRQDRDSNARDHGAPPFDVYLVRFADGEQLCGLHQRKDGVLDALSCV